MGAGLETKETVVIGGGQSGLAISRLLTERGVEHVVLEKAGRIGEAWRGRWDSFTLVTPNWSLRLPGYPYDGDDPDGFMHRDGVVGYLEGYAESFDPPLALGVEVSSVERTDDGYVVHTGDGGYRAQNVVVAAGTFQEPKIPGVAEGAPSGVEQLHSSEYRSPDPLPDGSVLVVGSGQSGSQIAEELKESGKEVYLATSKAGRLPRRYRGKDGMFWAEALGLMGQTVEDLDSPEERFGANPQISGRDGGKDIDLHEFARDGINLLGHLEHFDGSTAIFADDLHENLAAGDEMARQIRLGIDKYVEATGMEAPGEEVEELRDGYAVDAPTRVDLDETGIGVILWATGFSWDFGWVDAPVLDEWGYPITNQGITDYPGLYFLGLHFLHTRKSGLFAGVAEDAEKVADHIRQRSRDGAAG